MKTNPFDSFTDEYEAWFNENETIFQSELLALRQVVPIEKNGIEIGIGSGIFAEKLAVKFGVDPSENMLEYAKKRNLNVQKAVSENLPFNDKSFDFALFITSMCFVGNPQKAVSEAYRVTNDSGQLIIAFIDKNSTLGKILENSKENDKFYKHAKFYSVDQISSIIENNNYQIIETVQTLIDMNTKTPEKPVAGHGKGAFVVIKARKV